MGVLTSQGARSPLPPPVAPGEAASADLPLTSHWCQVAAAVAITVHSKGKQAECQHDATVQEQAWKKDLHREIIPSQPSTAFPHTSDLGTSCPVQDFARLPLATRHCAASSARFPGAAALQCRMQTQAAPPPPITMPARSPWMAAYTTKAEQASLTWHT